MTQTIPAPTLPTQPAPVIPVLSDTTDWPAYGIIYGLHRDPANYGIAWCDSGYTKPYHAARWCVGGHQVKQGKSEYTAEPPRVDDLSVWFNTGVTAQASGITSTDAYLKDLAANGHVPSPAERESFYAGIIAGVEADRIVSIPMPSRVKQCYRCDSTIEVNYTGLCWSCRQVQSWSADKVTAPSTVVNTYDGSFVRGADYTSPDLPEGELLALLDRVGSKGDPVETRLGLLVSALLGNDSRAILRVAWAALNDAGIDLEAAVINKLIAVHNTKERQELAEAFTDESEIALSIGLK